MLHPSISAQLRLHDRSHPSYPLRPGRLHAPSRRWLRLRLCGGGVEGGGRAQSSVKPQGRSSIPIPELLICLLHSVPSTAHSLTAGRLSPCLQVCARATPLGASTAEQSAASPTLTTDTSTHWWVRWACFFLFM